jgi:hypothetical protein
MTTSYEYDEDGAFIYKDPNAILDYPFDWTDWLGADTIATVQFTPSSAITVVSSSSTTKIATAWVSGGVAGTVESLTCRVNTVGGRTEDRTIRFKIKQR